MGSLDQRGNISIAVIVAYVAVFCLALLLTLRHGFNRQGGWIFLLTFAIVRIVGGALHIAAEKSNPPDTGLFIGAFTLESAGIAPLMLCTSAFLGTVGTNTDLPFARPKLMRLLRLIITIVFALAIVGASDAASSSQSKRSTGTTLRRVSAVIVLGIYAVLVGIHALFWTNSSILLRHHKTLLLGISCALPFLGIRVLYSVLSAFSPAPNFSGSNPFANESTSGLSKFNPITGEWQIFLVMSLLMEFIVVAIYIAFGITLPLSKEENYKGTGAQSPDSDYEMNNGPYAPGQQRQAYNPPYA